VAETRASMLDLAARSKFAEGGETITETRHLVLDLYEPAVTTEVGGLHVELAGMPSNVSPSVQSKTNDYVQKHIDMLYDVG
jgi:hypothetical protein